MSAVLIVGKASTVTIGLTFTWVILLPALATGLIVVAVVSARGEKAENEKLAGRWGRHTRRSDD